MKFSLLVIAVLSWQASPGNGEIRYESSNRFNRGVQTFDSSAEGNQEEPSTMKPLPQSYTVVDWKRFYPFGNKFPDSNHTDGSAAEAPTTTEQPKSEKDAFYPVYIKVPIRVPLKALYRNPEVKPKIVMPRTIRGTNMGYRMKVQPKYMMLRHAPMRRHFFAYYKNPTYLYRRPRKYIGSLYHKAGIHDLYKKNVYYPLRSNGYQVTEPRPSEWYDPAKVNSFA